MNLIKLFKDADVGSAFAEPFVLQKERKAARAVVFMDGKVGLMHATSDNYYKLPGGGVEGDEDFETALYRECIEELGTEVKIIDEVGMIIEERAESGLRQTSWCYLADQIGEIGNPAFTEKELAAGLQVVWADNIDAAIALVQDNVPDGSGAKFMRARDASLLQTAKEILGR